MMIEKAMVNRGHYLRAEHYYSSAREAMYDLLKNMLDNSMIDTILLPGYIGWSAREGSGIFDPVSRLTGLSVLYYKMTRELEINREDLYEKIKKLPSSKFAVLLVNYFGFPDTGRKEISELVKADHGWLIEDNAHAFFTCHFSEEVYSDAAFFSLHKMFPFPQGGSLVLTNPELLQLQYQGMGHAGLDPFSYDLPAIARIRRSNYRKLESILADSSGDEITLLKKDGLTGFVVPQSLPVKIILGDRNRIYERMNQAGYGVVSLYHTLIEPLRTPEYAESLALSEGILNLPVHQDVDAALYPDMVRRLLGFCRETAR